MVQAMPKLAPLIGDMTLFAVRSFRAGRGLEASFEDATRMLTEMAEAPPPEEQGPSPGRSEGARRDAEGRNCGREGRAGSPRFRR